MHRQNSNPGFTRQNSNPGFSRQNSNPNFARQNSNPNFSRHNSTNNFQDPIQLATAIFHAGHKATALRILEDELETDKQVETLLEWFENTPAFIKALESGNPDLIHLVMMKLRERTTSEEFHKTIRNFPIAVTLFKKYCREFNRQKLYEVYVHEKDFSAQAMTFISKSLDEKESHIKVSLLTSASEAFSKGRNTFNTLLCEEQLNLLTFQKEHNEKNPNCNCFGKTIHETCSLLLRNDPQTAEEFRNLFQIPEKRFWWLKIQTLADMEDWTSLENVSKMKKCPIKREKFVEVCLEKNNKDEALKYLPKLREKLKLKYYIKLGYLEEAAGMAFKKNDHYTLLLVKSLCQPHSALAEKVKSMIGQLDNANCQIWHGFSV